MGMLIYGGLNPLGTYIISCFLEEGIETIAVKSDLRDGSEEEMELFFGRNALYRSIDGGERDGGTPHASIACFVGPLLIDKGKAVDEVQEDLQQLLTENEWLETIILITGTGVGAEKKSEIPDGLSKESKALEEGFIKTIQDQEQSVSLCVLEVPFANSLSLHYSQKNERGQALGDCVLQLTQIDASSGIHHYIIEESGQEEEENGTKSHTLTFRLVEQTS